MTSTRVEPRRWPLRRWGAMVTLIFGFQVGMIFWLGSTAPILPGLAAPTFSLRLAGQGYADLWALNDPTLFALPHPQGFSGPVWRRMPRPEFHPFEWSAPTDRLPLAFDRLGTVFNQLIETSEFNVLRLPAQPEAIPTIPNLAPLAIMADRSVLELKDGLAQLRLLAPPKLNSFTNADILPNSVVQALVDAGGRPASVTLLSNSGSTAADQYALEQAWAARFEPLGLNPTETASGPAAQFSRGRMIFRWHTVPMPPASAPAAGP